MKRSPCADEAHTQEGEADSSHGLTRISAALLLRSAKETLQRLGQVGEHEGEQKARKGCSDAVMTKLLKA